MNTTLERRLSSYPTGRARLLLFTLALLLVVGLAASCNSPQGPTSPVSIGEPGPDCLTVRPCESYPCEAGASWDLASTSASRALTRAYGSAGCPKYYILDIQNSAKRPAGSMALRVAPAAQPRPCEKSELHVFVYGHTASGWTPIPAMRLSAFPIHLQGQCALSDLEATFGGMPEFDRFRVLAGAISGSGQQLPITFNLAATGT